MAGHVVLTPWPCLSLVMWMEPYEVNDLETGRVSGLKWCLYRKVAEGVYDGEKAM